MALIGIGQWDLDGIKQAILDGLTKEDTAEILVATQTGDVLTERAREVIPVEWEDPLDQMIHEDLDLLTIALVADEDFSSKVDQSMKGLGWSLDANWIPEDDTWNLVFIISLEIGGQDEAAL